MAFFESLWHAILHAIEHTLPLVPFLYLTYLGMELLERRMNELVGEAKVELKIPADATEIDILSYMYKEKKGVKKHVGAMMYNYIASPMWYYAEGQDLCLVAVGHTEVTLQHLGKPAAVLLNDGIVIAQLCLQLFVFRIGHLFPIRFLQTGDLLIKFQSHNSILLSRSVYISQQGKWRSSEWGIRCRPSVWGSR